MNSLSLSKRSQEYQGGTNLATVGRKPDRAYIARISRCGSANHLVRLEEHGRRNGEAERLGGLEVDHQLELRGLLHREVGGLGALEDLVHIGGRASPRIRQARPIGHEAPSVYIHSPGVHCGQPERRGELHNPSAQTSEQYRVRQHDERVRTRAGHYCKGIIQFLSTVYLHDVQVQT
jgi:hypothetical protein